MTDDKMQPTGMDVETARLLAKDFGVELELVATTGASRIPSLQTGKADLVISTLSVTAERAKVIDFSFPYAAMRSVLAGTKSVGINSMADLDGKTVGTTRGTTHDAYLTQNAKNSKIVRYEDDATAAQAFASGRRIFSPRELLLGPISQKSKPELGGNWCSNLRLAIGIRGDATARGGERLIGTNMNGKLNEITRNAAETYSENAVGQRVIFRSPSARGCETAQVRQSVTHQLDRVRRRLSPCSRWAWLTVQLTVVSIAPGLAIGIVCYRLAPMIRRLWWLCRDHRNTRCWYTIVYFGLPRRIGLSAGAAIIALVINGGDRLRQSRPRLRARRSRPENAGSRLQVIGHTPCCLR